MRMEDLKHLVIDSLFGPAIHAEMNLRKRKQIRRRVSFLLPRTFHKLIFPSNVEAFDLFSLWKEKPLRFNSKAILKKPFRIFRRGDYTVCEFHYEVRNQFGVLQWPLSIRTHLDLLTIQDHSRKKPNLLRRFEVFSVPRISLLIVHTCELNRTSLSLASSLGCFVLTVDSEMHHHFCFS